MKEKRPILVTYISDLNFLTVFLLIVSLFQTFTKPLGIIVSTPSFSNVPIRIFIILILLTISYGLLKLKRWGYLLMIAYHMIFLVLSIISILKYKGQSYYSPIFIAPIIGLALTFSAKRYFMKEKCLPSAQSH